MGGRVGVREGSGLELGVGTVGMGGGSLFW